MVDDKELRNLIDKARERGAILRTKVDNDGCVSGVSIGMRIGGKHPEDYRRLGQPGAGWLPPIAAAERLREMLFNAHLKSASETVSEWPDWKRKVLG